MKIVFLGNMNNLPYYFATEFKKRGFDVTFIVDAEEENLLDRPESWDNELKNNYPDWLKEIPLSNNLKALKFSLPPIYLKKYISLINEYDVVFLNGFWISIAIYVKPPKRVVAVVAGFELDVLASKGSTTYLSQSFYQTANFVKKLIPVFITKLLFKKLINLQRLGFRRSEIVNYFPTGINPDADKLLNEIKAGQSFKRLELRGFDCNKFPYKEPSADNKKFTILNVTRFFYLNQRNDNKRNDLMIKGIGYFLKKNKLTPNDVKIIFFEKGDDIDEAKKLCVEYGLEPFLTWQTQTSVQELNRYFYECDVAFDQLGVQWVGAGLFSMLTGRPLIANGRPDVFEPLTNEKSPICQASSAEEVEKWLTNLYYNRFLVTDIGKESRNYVLRHYRIENTINYFVDCLK